MSGSVPVHPHDICTACMDTARERAEAVTTIKSLRGQRDALYWFHAMTKNGGPDGSELDDAVCEDAAAVAAVIDDEHDGAPLVGGSPRV